MDAKHIGEHLSEKKPDDVVNEAVQQVAFADRILFNKMDLVSDVERNHVLMELRSINQFAEVIQCQKSVVDLDKILGMKSFSVENAMETDPAIYEDLHPKTKSQECTEPTSIEANEEGHNSHSHGHSHGHAHGQHEHGHTDSCEAGCREDHNHSG